MSNFSRNGRPPAPQPTGGAFASQHPPTEFLPDLAVDSLAMFLYQLDHAELMGFSLLRWGYALCVGLAVIWLPGFMPGGWLVALLWLGMAITAHVAIRLGRRHRFVRFFDAPAAVPAGHALVPAQKIPVYVTGRLSVESKQASFTALPGFYRTFATREHALLCQVRDRRVWWVANWPDDEIGLWYAFFRPEQIEVIRSGTVQIGRRSMPAIAVDYRRPPDQGKRRREPTSETLIMGFQEAADQLTVLADLYADQQPVTTPGSRP